MNDFNHIIFDFDGVILDSMAIKRNGFQYMFRDYTPQDVEKLLEYHDLNGHISRFEKLIYFYEKILNQPLPSKEEQEQRLKDFSQFVDQSLFKEGVLIQETVDFLKMIQQHAPHVICDIASGAYEEELIDLCKKYHLDQYFQRIYGSPKKKVDLIDAILKETQSIPEKVLYIGDSYGDYEACLPHRIRFYGYNNPALKGVGEGYLDHYQILKEALLSSRD